MADAKHETIVVLGKRTVRKTEEPHLATFGRVIALRGKTLVTTRTEGVAAHIAKAYADAGGTPVYMTSTDYAHWTENFPVIAFTDTKYQEHLDKVAPNWKDFDWITIHNPKATEEAAAFLINLCEEFGTPLEVSS